MKINLFHHKLLGWIGFCSLLLLCVQASAQQKPDVVGGVFRIKVTPETAKQLERAGGPSADRDGIAITGFSAMDQLSRKFKATQITRTFRHAGKYERKHMRHGLHLWYDVKIDESQNVHEATDAYARLSTVNTAEPCLKKKRGVERHEDGQLKVTPLENEPNDPAFPLQWHYNNTGQGGGKPGADVSLLKAWNLETGSPEVIIGVVDGGIDATHQDIAANMWINTDEIPDNGIDDDNNGYVDDIHGYGFGDDSPTIPGDTHGTHVGGTVAAVTNNGIGMSGVAGGSGNGSDGARLMSCAAFGSVGIGHFAEAYTYSADNGAVISQNSWGYTNSGYFEQAVLDAIDYFIAEAGYDENDNPVGPMQGGIVIFAAGNDGTDEQWYPGIYEPVFAVSGSDRNDNQYLSSNRGDWVEVTAPAVQVQSTFPNNQYGALTGTSMACPHVSGTAALIVSKFAGSITPQQVKDRLISFADKVSTLPTGFGSGRLNAFASLQEDDGNGPEAITNLTVVGTSEYSADLTWTAPSDPGNGSASIYDIRYATFVIDESNFNSATAVTPPVPANNAGTTENYTVEGLNLSTTYYFAIKAIDLFGNASLISNVVSGETEKAPVIGITPESLTVDIDVTMDPKASRMLTMSNSGEGADLQYSSAVILSGGSRSNVKSSHLDMTHYGKGNPSDLPEALAKSLRQRSSAGLLADNVNAVDSIFYDSGDGTADNFGGLNTSAYTTAIRYEIDRPSFTLTHYKNFFRTETVTSPVTLLEVYKGDNISDAELLLSQEVNFSSTEGEFFTTALQTPQTFVEGDVFWVVCKYGTGITYPQGVDENFSQKPNTFFFSSDGGSSFNSSTFVFKQRALSANTPGGTSWVGIDPAQGDIMPGDSTDISVSFDATSVSNGSYNLILRFNSNDPATPVLDIPAKVTVEGQTPKISVSSELLEFGSVFVGANKAQDLTIINNGLGVLNISNISSSMPQFTIDANAQALAPGEELVVKITFAPSSGGNSSGYLTIDNDSPQGAVKVWMAGTGTLPPVLEAPTDPVSSTLNSGETGDEPIVIGNSGEYPLTYSFPEIAARKLLSQPGIQPNDVSRIDGVDTQQEKGVEIHGNGHPVTLGAGTDQEFGYSWIDSDEAGGPIFVWNDIKETGTEILPNGDDNSQEVALPFPFTFYGEEKNSVNVGSNGYLTFGSSGGAYFNSQIPTAGVPNDFIAPFWDDLVNNGGIFYQNMGNKFVVQYDNVNRYSSVGTATFQVVLYSNGKIMFYYKDMNTLGNLTSATIGIENADGSDGVQVVYNNDFVKDNLAVAIAPPGSEFISDVHPMSGVIGIGGSDTISVTLDASELFDGVYENSLSVSTNDPANTLATIPFELTVIGQPELNISPDTLAFGDLILGYGQKKSFQITNSGSKSMIIRNVSGGSEEFTFDFTGPVSLEPGAFTNIEVTFSPSSLGSFSSIVTVTSDELADSGQLLLTGAGVEAPAIAVTPDSISVVADAGTVLMDTVTIANTGGSTLKYSISMPQWLQPSHQSHNAPIIDFDRKLGKMDEDLRAGHPALLGGGSDVLFGYTWEDNKEGSGPVYDFADITTTGTDVTTSLVNSQGYADGSTEVSIGFDFEFYGNAYDKVNVSANGLLLFGDQTPSTYSNEQIPENDETNNLIAGLWDDLEPGTKSGTVHYQSSPERFTVQYTGVEGYGNNASGQVTFQIILFPNGDIKYLYEDVLGANFLNKATVGIEDAEGNDGIQVVFNNSYLQDKLAVLFKGPAQGTVAPGTRKEIPVEISAVGLNDGAYTDNIRVRSNDPDAPMVSIPATLKVIGLPYIALSSDSLDFGTVFVSQDTSISTDQSLTIYNKGSRRAIIDSLSISGEGFSTSQNMPIILLPKDSIVIDLTFSPKRLGMFMEKLSLFSNAEAQTYDVSLKGKGIAPPKFSIQTDSDTIFAKVKYQGSVRGNFITLINSGGSDLDFDTKVLPLARVHASSGAKGVVMLEKPLPGHGIARAGLSNMSYKRLYSNDVTFTDSIAYEDEATADDFVGINNPSFTFISATKFVASDGGFNLSHVRNLYRTESSSEDITMNIYRGGNVPTAGELELTQSYDVKSTEGSFELITLDQPLSFSPGETFWVTFRYPASITFGQGIQENVSNISGIYYYSSDEGASWRPAEGDIPGAAFKVRAFSSGGSANWVVLDPENGQVAENSEQKVEVILDAAELNPGKYSASIRIATNDPYNPEASVPVKLEVNAPPVFVNPPADTLEIDENELLEMRFEARDSDSRVKRYSMKEDYPNAFFSAQARPPFLKFKPNYDQSGYYTFTISAFDEMEDEAQISFVVKVNDVNRNPIITKQLQWDRVVAGSPTKSLDLSEYLTDPDGDTLSYTVSVSDPNGYLNLEVKGDILRYTPVKSGFVFVSIVAEDGRGGVVGTSTAVLIRKPNRAPEVIKTEGEMVLEGGNEPLTLNLGDYFSDPDEDDVLHYEVHTEDGSVATATITEDHLLEISHHGTGTARFVVVATDLEGAQAKTTFTSRAKNIDGTEDVVKIANYPNPFDAETIITYHLDQSSHVRLEVLTSEGKFIKTLVDGKQSKGDKKVSFYGEQLPTGTYLYRLVIDGQVTTKRMVKK